MNGTGLSMLQYRCPTKKNGLRHGLIPANNPERSQRVRELNGRNIQTIRQKNNPSGKFLENNLYKIVINRRFFIVD